MNINNKRAFTLVELLVVIAIIGVISTLATISFSNSRLSARDAKRLSDIRLMSNALELYYADHGSYPDEVDFQPGQPLISTDGQIIYLASVPDNPIPWTDGDCPEENYGYETSDGSSYLITTCLGGESATFAPGAITYSPEEGLIGQAPEGGGGGGPVAGFNCGDPIEDDDGNEYNTVQIGTQCWMKENLNTKIRPNGTCINGGGNPPCPTASTLDNGLGRSCNTNNEAVCDTNGSLYTWAAVMNGSTTPGARGICFEGWHVPTDDEFKVLEMHLGMTQEQADGSSWRGNDEGRKLKSERTVNGNPPPGIPTNDDPRWDYHANFGTDTSGLSLVPTGNRDSGGSSFNSRFYIAYLWTSSSSLYSSSAWFRQLRAVEGRVNRSTLSYLYASAVRCLKD